jgi:hypothetical protein
VIYILGGEETPDGCGSSVFDQNIPKRVVGRCTV